MVWKHSSSWLCHLFQFEKLEGIPELGVITEQAEGESDRDDRLCLPQTPGDVPDPVPIIPLPSPDQHLQHQRQVRNYFCIILTGLGVGKTLKLNPV